MKLFEVFGEIKIDNKQANKALDTTEGKGESLGKKFGGLAKKSVALKAGLAAVAVGAVKAITDITKASIKAFDEQERAEKRLVSIARTVTKATDEQIESLKELASAYQEVTTFGDDVIISGQSQLLSFGVSAQGAEQLTQSLVDLLAATKGANATQEDAINAANLLGKAYSGQAGALSKAGILLNEQQAELLKTGTETQRVAALTEILNQNYGQLAQGLAETREGQMIQFQNAIGDLGERFAGVLMPALQGFTKFLKEVVLPTVEGLVVWIEENGPAIGTTFKAAFDLVFSVIRPFIPIIKTLLSILGDLVRFIAEYITATFRSFESAITITLKVLEPLIIVLEGLLKIIGAVTEFVADKFSGVGDMIKDGFGDVVEFIDGIFESVKNLIGAFQEFFNLIDKRIDRNLQRYGVEGLAPFNLAPVIEQDIVPQRNQNVTPFLNRDEFIGSTQNTFEPGAIQVTIPVEELAEIQTVTDFFNRVPELRRGIVNA